MWWQKKMNTNLHGYCLNVVIKTELNEHITVALKHNCGNEYKDYELGWLNYIAMKSQETVHTDGEFSDKGITSNQRAPMVPSNNIFHIGLDQFY